jgi:type II secretory pathway component PulF
MFMYLMIMFFCGGFMLLCLLIGGGDHGDAGHGAIPAGDGTDAGGHDGSHGDSHGDSHGGRVEALQGWLNIKVLSAFGTAFVVAMLSVPSLYASALLVPAAAVAVPVVLAVAAFSVAFRRTWDRVKLLFPVFGTMARDQAISSWSRMLGLLMGGGVPVLQAMNITRGTCSNKAFADMTQAVHDAIKEGDSMVSPLKATRVLPSVAVEMVGVGEETGALPEMLCRIADLYDGDVERRIRSINMASLTVVALSVLAVAAALVARL